MIWFLMLLLAASIVGDAAAQTKKPPRPTTSTTTSKPVVIAPAPPKLPTSAAASQNSTNGEALEDDEVISVETDLVSVPVVVTNAGGQPIANLRREDFRVIEDNRPQQLASFSTTDAPFEVALLLDTSGSTRSELGLIRRAALAFIEALRDGDRVAIISFSARIEDGKPRAAVDIKQTLTADRAQLQKAIEGLEVSNSTPYYDALERIGKEIFNQPPAPALRGRRAVVALTDGVDSSSEAEYDEARAAIAVRGVLSYLVQINTESFVEDRLLRDCDDDGRFGLSRSQLQRYRRIFAPQTDAGDFADFCSLGQFQRMQISRDLYNLARREMNELALVTGGKTFPAFDLRDARRAFALVANEIGTQYSLGYYSTNKGRNGAFRKIKVEVPKLKGAQVQAREGYNAPRR